ncbi:hypothetical protein AOLI_G00131150 [Acnodon oligacanthus]
MLFRSDLFSGKSAVVISSDKQAKLRTDAQGSSTRMTPASIYILRVLQRDGWPPGRGEKVAVHVQTKERVQGNARKPLELEPAAVGSWRLLEATGSSSISGPGYLHT